MVLTNTFVSQFPYMNPTYNIVVAHHANTVVAKRKIGLIHERGSQAELTMRPMIRNKQAKKTDR